MEIQVDDGAAGGGIGELDRPVLMAHAETVDRHPLRMLQGEIDLAVIGIFLAATNRPAQAKSKRGAKK